MAAKEKLLALLEAHKGSYLSGQDMARQLGISRAAVCKAIKMLRDQGYAIDAVTNRGYCLSQRSDILSPQGIAACLNDPFWEIHVVDTIDSTNNQVRALAALGQPEGYVLAANSQSGGRGRSGRAFFSPPDTGVYLSLLLRPRELEPTRALQLTTMAASALCLAIREVTGREAGIKWVNDIFMNGKKICGILTEASFDLEAGGLDYAVVGLGIDLYPPKDGFPEELRNIAGSLCESQDSGLKNRLIAAFLRYFGDFYQERRFREAAQVYREHSFLIGKEVLVEGKAARVLDITDRCQLLVRYDSGEIQALSYGEVSIVNPNLFLS